LKCKLGIHEYTFTFIRDRFGQALGDKCKYCGIWKKEK